MRCHISRHRLAVLVLLLLLSIGCGLSGSASPTGTVEPTSTRPPTLPPGPTPQAGYTLGPGDYDLTLQHGGLTRIYAVHVPPSYDMTPVPVVINFHGGGGNAESAEESIGGMNVKSDREGFLAVYPVGAEGVGQPEAVSLHYWNAGRAIKLGFIDYTVDDVGFVSAMLDALERDFAVDANRIYATGISNGAWMCYALACRLPERIAAIAPVAGGLATEDCHPSRPVSIMHVHGKQDPGWPYHGGQNCWSDSYRPPIADTISTWLEMNDCGTSSQITFQNGEATCETYGCAQDTVVTLCTIADGGHTFPGGRTNILERLVVWDEDCALGEGQGVGTVSQDISALDEMWSFFVNHPRD